MCHRRLLAGRRSWCRPDHAGTSQPAQSAWPVHCLAWSSESVPLVHVWHGHRKYQMLATLCHGQISVPGPGSSVVASLVGSVPACAPRSAPDTATEPVIAGDLERRTNRATSAIVAVPLTAGTTTEMITALSIRPTRLNIQILATLCHWLVAFVPLVVTSPDMERSASIVVRW